MTFAAPTITHIADQASEKLTRPLRAISLDVDDTLVDYAGSARNALSVMLGSDCVVDSVWHIWEQLTDDHAAAVVAGKLDYGHGHAVRTRAFFSAIGQDVDEDEAWHRERIRSTAMRECLRLFEDTLDCLDWLRAAGMKIAAVTNASGAHQRIKLAELGLADFFDAVVIAGEIGVAKPDPVIFHTACAELGCSPDETVHVGDRLDADAIGAARAGLHGVWLERHGRAGLSGPDGIWVVNSLAELPELLVCELTVAGL